MKTKTTKRTPKSGETWQTVAKDGELYTVTIERVADGRVRVARHTTDSVERSEIDLARFRKVWKRRPSATATELVEAHDAVVEAKKRLAEAEAEKARIADDLLAECPYCGAPEAEVEFLGTFGNALAVCRTGCGGDW